MPVFAVGVLPLPGVLGTSACSSSTRIAYSRSPLLICLTLPSSFHFVAIMLPSLRSDIVDRYLTWLRFRSTYLSVTFGMHLYGKSVSSNLSLLMRFFFSVISGDRYWKFAPFISSQAGAADSRFLHTSGLPSVRPR